MKKRYIGVGILLALLLMGVVYARVYTDELSVTGNATITGTLTGGSPLKVINQGLQFVSTDKSVYFSQYHTALGEAWSNVSGDFNNTIVFQIDEIMNPSNISFCFWNKQDQVMEYCFNAGGLARATTVRRSFQVVGNITVKPNDENFTLCEGANYIDCDTDATGADLFVQDDIEAQSIYANENITTNTLNVTGYNTGDVLNNEIDLYVGTDYGAMKIGSIQLFQSNLNIAGLNVNGTFITRHTGGNSSIRFAWLGADNLVRLAIPKEGADYALYNPRSEMIGGNLGQAFNNNMVNCTGQGYRFIDCATGATGADLGLQDDFEFWGSLYGGNGTWNVTDEGNLTVNRLASSDLSGNYSNGEAYLCVDNDGVIFAKDSSCS